MKRHPPTSICRVGVCVCLCNISIYISPECFPRHSSQMHESSKPPKKYGVYIYVYIIEVDTGNTDLLYNTVCISVFCNCVKPQNLKPLYICICMYIYMCIYIYMYVWVEVTRRTLYIDDIYMYVCIYMQHICF